MSWKVWWMAIRPKTLWLSLSPVVLGSLMAYLDGKFHLLSALGCLLMALCIQMATNFVNDYADFKKGADDATRLGPTRVTQAGLVTPEAMKWATFFVIGVAFLLAALLMLRGGWPMLVIGIASIISGVLYTAGPYPLGYHGLGDLFVLIFFGPVAVGGTYYVQALSIHPAILICGIAPGLFSTAVLAINNLRDIEGDRRCGKRTLAVRFGKSFAKWEYLLCLLVGVMNPLLLYLFYDYPFWGVLTFAIVPLALPIVKTVWTNSEGAALNEALAATGKLLTIFTLLTTIGWLI